MFHGDHLVARLALAAALFCYRTAADTVVEELASAPEGWIETGKPAGSDPIVLQIGLQQQNLDRFEQTLREVSSPEAKAPLRLFLRNAVLETFFVAKWVRFKVTGRVDQLASHFHREMQMRPC